MVVDQAVIVEVMGLVVLDLVVRTVATVLFGLVPALHRAAAHAIRGKMFGVCHSKTPFRLVRVVGEQFTLRLPNVIRKTACFWRNW